MHTLNRDYFRMARLIESKLSREPKNFPSLALREPQWRSLKSTMRGIALAQSRGWYHATRLRQEQLVHELDDLQVDFRRQVELLREQLAPRAVATLADLYRDLVALESEFAEVLCDVASHLLAVTTRPIVLQGIDLGPFQIRLDLQRDQGAQVYTVVAQMPQPAQSNEEVTHPHVSDETLCEGDGRHAIASALTDGRLYDFFMIVDRLLNTYAPGRAYVELDQWHGIPCHDCGQTVCDDDRYLCNRCEGTLCSDCATICSQCENPHCSNCSSSCALCDRPVCSNCLERCRACGNSICADCLTHTLCTQCHENQSDEDQTDDLETCGTAESQPAFHSDGLGQTALSA